MNVLALDLATRTGWALLDDIGIESGVEDFTKKRGESNGMLFHRFNRWLKEFTLGPQIIVYEQAHHRGGAATEIAVGLVTRVLEFCAVNKLDHAPVHSATLKKWATGNGRARKDEMIAAVRRRGFVHLHYIPDDNEADALLLLAYALEEILGEKAWNARSAEVKQPSKIAAVTT